MTWLDTHTETTHPKPFIGGGDRDGTGGGAEGVI